MLEAVGNVSESPPQDNLVARWRSLTRWFARGLPLEVQRKRESNRMDHSVL